MNIKAFRLTQASTSIPRRPGNWPALVCALLLLQSAGWASAAIAQSAQPDRSSASTQEAPIEEAQEVQEVQEQPADAEPARDGVELLDGIQRSLDGPDVVITAGKDRTVFEYRQNGQLRLVKIVPRLGRPYYLVPADPTRGFGDLNQAGTLLPQWTIIEF